MIEELVKLPIEEAASLFNKSTDTIYYWIRTGKYQSEQGDNTKLLVLTNEQYQKLLPKINNQLNKNVSTNESNLNSNEIQQQFKQETLEYIVDNLRYFADKAIEEKEQRILLIEDSEKRKERDYLEAQAKLKEVENKNAVLEHQLNEYEIKLNTIESKLNEIEAENAQLKTQLKDKNKSWWQFGG